MATFSDLIMAMKWILKYWICQKRENRSGRLVSLNPRSDCQFPRSRKGQVYDGGRGALPEFLCALWL